jgi:anti-sigma B factor antagonist
MFELSVKHSDEQSNIIVLTGEIDIYSAPDFKEQLYRIIGEGRQSVILECEELSYIDSMGLGILVGALKRLKEQERDIVVRNPKSNIRKLLRITGLDKVFIIEEAKS